MFVSRFDHLTSMSLYRRDIGRISQNRNYSTGSVEAPAPPPFLRQRRISTWGQAHRRDLTLCRSPVETGPLSAEIPHAAASLLPKRKLLLNAALPRRLSCADRWPFRRVLLTGGGGPPQFSGFSFRPPHISSAVGTSPPYPTRCMTTGPTAFANTAESRPAPECAGDEPW